MLGLKFNFILKDYFYDFKEKSFFISVSHSLHAIVVNTSKRTQRGQDIVYSKGKYVTMAWKQIKVVPNSALQHGNGFIKFLEYQNKVNHKSRHFPLLEIPGRQVIAKMGKFQFYVI